MSYKLNYDPKFEETLKKIDRQSIEKILRKLEWLARSAEQLRHEKIKNPPANLEGICKLRVGFYRVLYWIEHTEKEITVYDVILRKGEYKELYR